MSFPNQPGTRLRVGLMLAGRTVPEWVHRLVEELVASPLLELALVIDEPSPPRPSRAGRLLREPRHLLYRLYTRVDHRLFRDRPDAFRPHSLSPLLDGVPALAVEPVRTRYSDRFGDGDVERIRRHDLDVALRFAPRILRGEALAIARHGVWSYHHGDSRTLRGGPPGFWEVMERHATTGVTLQALTEELDGGRVLARGVYSTYPRSVRRNRNRVYLKAIPLARRRLEELARSGTLEELPDAAPFQPHDGPLYRKPGNLRTLGLLGGLARRAVAHELRKRTQRKRWFLAYAFHDEEPPPPLRRFRELAAPAGRFWADPFPIRASDGHYLLHEEYRDEEGKGVIVARRGDGHGGWESPVTVLERPHHLSYPFAFRHRGEHYMVPESASRGTVELYRAVSFPWEWEPCEMLLEDVRAVDATLVEVDGTWWMFVNQAGEHAPDANDELHLYRAARPAGPWSPHPRNPVKVDCRSARPAGRLFWHGGELYRPAQDGSRRYGWAVTFQRVRRLTRDEYSETEVGRLEPRWRPGLLATHTYNRVPGLTVVDAMERCRRGAP